MWLGTMSRISPRPAPARAWNSSSPPSSSEIRPGSVNENLIDFTDFLPTFREAAGQGDGQTTSPAERLDGISFLGQLRGLESRVREAVFCYYHPQLYNDKKLIWAHDKTWKLYSDDRFFNVAADPLEETPLDAATLPPAARQARDKLRQVIDRTLAAPSPAPGQ